MKWQVNQLLVLFHVEFMLVCQQQLLTQYRAQILGLRRQLQPANVGLKESLDREQRVNVEAENVCSSA